MISNKLFHLGKVFGRHFWTKCEFRQSELTEDAKIGRASSKKRLFFLKGRYFHFIFSLVFSTFSVSHLRETFKNDAERAVALQAPLPFFVFLPSMIATNTTQAGVLAS